MTLILAATTLAALPQAADAARLSQRPLKTGDRGGDVRELQRVVTKLKVRRLSADGAYGSRTASAVKRYEKRVHIKVDGRVSVGQARGMLRRAGKPLPPRRAKTAAPAPVSAVAATDATGVYPIDGKVTVGDRFGTRGGRHQGVDLLTPCGTPLVAISGAKITRRATAGSSGRHLIITQPDGTEWIYMHMSTVDVHTGDTVVAGQKVGEVGQTGNATACHLHLELRPAPGRNAGARPLDPMPTLDKLPTPGSQPVAPTPDPTPADPAGGAAAG